MLHTETNAFTLPARRRVLVVEDDAELRALLLRVLAVDGFDVVAVRDGAGALRYLHGGRLPDLIIADGATPRLGRLELLLASGAPVPTILMSGLAESATRDQARRLGVAFTFSKPFDIDDLRTAVLHLLHA